MTLVRALAAAAWLLACVAAPAGAAGFRARAVDGATVDLDALLERGPVVLDFWATWCRPCEHSLPAVQRLHEKYRARGLSVVGVSIDGPRNWTRVRPFAARLGLAFPIVIDEDGSLARRYQVTAVPTSVLIGRDGRVVSVRTGWRPGEEDGLEALVLEQLADTTRAGGR